MLVFILFRGVGYYGHRKYGGGGHVSKTERVFPPASYAPKQNGGIAAKRNK